MAHVDAHSMGRSRNWPAVDHRPQAARGAVAMRQIPHHEVGTNTDTHSSDILQMTRKERIRLLESMESSQESTVQGAPKKVTRGLTARRAHQERLISGKDALGAAGRTSVHESSGAKPSRARQLHVKAAQLNPDFDIDDGFSQAVETRRAALRAEDTLACAKVQLEPSSPGNTAGCPKIGKEKVDATLVTESSDISAARRQYQRIIAPRQTAPVSAVAMHHDGFQRKNKPNAEQVSAWLSEIRSAVEKDNRTYDFDTSCTERAAEFLRISGLLQTCAYSLRPHDALRAIIMLAQSLSLLECWQREAATVKIGIAHEDAFAAVRSAIEAIMAAIAMNITSCEAPYVAEVLLAIAATHAGRQEYLDAILGHMLWLLSAKPRSFQPKVVAQIFWALGRIQSECGTETESLSVISNDANRRALAALQVRLMEILDDFLEDDLGTLALDPTGGSLLGDNELRRVLHRAGRLQVGLRPDSKKYLAAMQRLEASARDRLWQPLQAEIMPFMRDYCDELFAARSVDQSEVCSSQTQQQKVWLPPSLR